MRIRPHNYTIKSGKRVRVKSYSRLPDQTKRPRQHDAHVKAWREEQFLLEYQRKWNKPWPGEVWR
jgi:hypothetical protein